MDGERSPVEEETRGGGLLLRPEAILLACIALIGVGIAVAVIVGEPLKNLPWGAIIAILVVVGMFVLAGRRARRRLEQMSSD